MVKRQEEEKGRLILAPRAALQQAAGSQKVLMIEKLLIIETYEYSL